MAALLSFEQQQIIKKVSENNRAQWEGIQRDAEEYYLVKLLGQGLAQKIQENPGNHVELLDGSEILYRGQRIKHKGLRYVLAYLTYARYVIESKVKDTFTGMVEKTRADSTAIEEGRGHILARNAEKIAMQAWELVKIYADMKYGLPGREKKDVARASWWASRTIK